MAVHKKGSMKTLTATVLTPTLNLIEWFDRLFRPVPPQKPAAEEEIFPIFENEPRAVVREIEEREAATQPQAPKSSAPEILAPRGICIGKSVKFLRRQWRKYPHHLYLSAKVVGYSWDDPKILLLSRNNGDPFRRQFCS